jgi:hypothetical protein
MEQNTAGVIFIGTHGRQRIQTWDGFDDCDTTPHFKSYAHCYHYFECLSDCHSSLEGNAHCYPNFERRADSNTDGYWNVAVYPGGTPTPNSAKIGVPSTITVVWIAGNHSALNERFQADRPQADKSHRRTPLFTRFGLRCITAHICFWCLFRRGGGRDR